jgi:hypothetical protein
MADSVFKKREIRLGIPAAGVFFAGRLTAGNLRAFLLLLDHAIQGAAASVGCKQSVAKKCPSNSREAWHAEIGRSNS